MVSSEALKVHLVQASPLVSGIACNLSFPWLVDSITPVSLSLHTCVPPLCLSQCPFSSRKDTSLDLKPTLIQDIVIWYPQVLTSAKTLIVNWTKFWGSWQTQIWGHAIQPTTLFRYLIIYFYNKSLREIHIIVPYLQTRDGRLGFEHTLSGMMSMALALFHAHKKPGSCPVLLPGPSHGCMERAHRHWLMLTCISAKALLLPLPTQMQHINVSPACAEEPSSHSFPN